MMPERYSARRIRARYLRALQAIPLPVRVPSEPDPVLSIDLAGLPILACETVDERAVRFSLVVGQSRFRLTFADLRPNLIGHVVALGTPGPRLVVAEPLHAEWASAHTEALIATAQQLWNDNVRECSR